MKKLLSILIAITLTLCAGATALAESKAPVKVAVVVADALGDLSFYDGANEGLQRLIADYQVDGKTVECKNDASKWQPMLVEAAQSYDIVVCVGWEFWSALEEVVPQMPETKFIFVDNGLDGLGDNLVSIVYADNEGSFLAGYAAMKFSKTGKIGVVGGEDCDTINNFILGYQEGAKYANPEGTVLAPMYTDSYDDSAKGKECALKLYSDGCDVVYQVASKAGLGVFEAAAETGNYAIGVDCDQKYINPDVIIASMVKNVGDSIYDVVAGYITDGSFAGGQILTCDMSGGYETLGYGSGDMPQQLTDELKGEIDLIAQQIVSGDIEVPSVFDVE